MADLPEYELLKTPDELTYRGPPRRPVGVWIAVAVLIIAIAVAAYIVFVRRPSPATSAVREPVDRPRAARYARFTAAEVFPTPPLMLYVARTVVNGMSARPVSVRSLRRMPRSAP